MTNPELQVEVRGDLIIITHPATQFFAIYAKPNNRSELVLKRRPDTGDNVLLVQVWQAANRQGARAGLDCVTQEARLHGKHHSRASLKLLAELIASWAWHPPAPIQPVIRCRVFLGRNGLGSGCRGHWMNRREGEK